jgi:membrane-associated protein
VEFAGVIAGLIETIVHWVEPLFGAAGYGIIAGAVLLERSVFVGLIIPGDVILALGGVFAARGDLSLVWVIVIGITAAVCGESAGFWLGRRYGLPLVRRLPFGNRLEKRLESAEEYFAKRGAGWTVAIGRFATAAGSFVPFAAGIGKMPYGRFLMFDVPAIVVWACGIAVFGYVAGSNLDLIERWLSRFGYAALGALALFFAGRWAWKRWRDRRSRRETSSSG